MKMDILAVKRLSKFTYYYLNVEFNEKRNTKMAYEELYKGPDLSGVSTGISTIKGEYTAADQARGFGIEISDADIEVQVGEVYLPLPVARAMAGQEAKIVG